MPLLVSWKRKWGANKPKQGLIKIEPLLKEPLKIYKELKKAESSVLTQIQTGRIGLVAFLNKARVPNFPSPICQYSQAEETALYIIAYCPQFTEQRQMLAVGRPDIKKLVSTAKGVQRLVRQFLRLQALRQFYYAEELLRGKKEKERGVSRLAR